MDASGLHDESPRSPRWPWVLVGVSFLLLFGGAHRIHTHGGIAHPNAWFAKTRSQVIKIDSKAAGRTLPTAVILPKGWSKQKHLPMLVLLHWRYELPQFILWAKLVNAVAAQGARAPIVVVPYSSPSSYWHNRTGQRWGDYVTDEVIPRVADQFGANSRRVAIGGISMGGFGALNFVRADPGRFCAVGGHSPAVRPTYGQTAPGSFDDAADFARNDVFGTIRTNPAAYLKLPIWLDVGASDPLLPFVTQLDTELRAAGANVTFHVWPGGHTWSYWSSHFADYLNFYELALAHC